MISRSCIELAQRRQVTREDVARVVRMAGRIPLEKGRVLVSVRPLCFRVDGAEVPEPVGMECRYLEMDAEILTTE